MFDHVLVALGLSAVTVIIHGVGTLILASALARFARSLSGAPRQLRLALGVVSMISFLLLLHSAEAGVWAAWYMLAGIFPDFETAAYFSLTSYTTVGYGDVLLPSTWRLLGPIEAGVGIIMFGWSTAIIVAILGRLFAARFQAAVDAHEPPRAP